MPPRPTVDELLAWLTGQGYALKPQTILPGNNITVEVWRGVDCVAVSTDRTLLTALEAAVRAADSTTPPRPVKGEGACVSQGR